VKTILVLGTGCPKCQRLHEHAEQAARELGIAYELVKVTDINAIIGFGVMTTPALVVDDVVKCTGQLPSVEQIKRMLS